MTEAELLTKYHTSNLGKYHNSNLICNASRLCEMLSNISNNGSLNDILISTIDFSVVKEIINEFIQFLDTMKRYNKLYKLFGGDLTWVGNNFIVSGHTFSTLDEVERAWNLKAFL